MLYPMSFMVLLTVIIGCIAFVVRVRSVSSRQLKPRAYLLMDADNYPELVIKTTRCFNNQFEIPVLFYVACLAYLTLNVTSAAGLWFAWAFVVCRLVHAVIHMTYNHLLHRIIAYWSSVFMMLLLWVVLLLNYSHSGF